MLTSLILYFSIGLIISIVVQHRMEKAKRNALQSGEIWLLILTWPIIVISGLIIKIIDK